MSYQVGYERQGGKKVSKSWSLRFFLLAINLFLIFLIIDLRFLETASYYLLGLSVLIMLVGFFRRRMSDEQATEDSIRDLLPLIGKYIRINRKFILASILGLILGVMVISQILIVSHSATGTSYNRVFAKGTVPSFEITSRDYVGSGLNPTNLSDVRDQVYQQFKTYSEEEGIRAKDVISFNEFRFEMMFLRDFGDGEVYQDYISFRNSLFTTERLNLLKQFPTFPEDVSMNSSILILSNWMVREFPNETQQLSDLHQANFTHFGEFQTNFTASFDEIWVMTERDRDYAIQEELYNMIWQLENTFLTSNANALEIFGGDISNEEKLFGFVDIDSLEDKTVQETLQIIRTINDKVFSYLSNMGYQINIQSEVEWRLNSYQYENASINLMLLIAAVPMIGIAMYLVYFSLNLVEIRKQKLVSIMKVRGISSSQLKVMLTTEAIAAAIIATVVGMLLSIPWSEFVFSSTQIFGEDTHILIPKDWYWKMPFIGLVLAIDLNIGAILSISSTTVEEGEESEETKEPFWRRLYLDVIFTVIGVGYWSAMHLVPMDPELKYILLFPLGFFALFFLIIGLPLFVSRYYSTFLSLLSDILWKREGNLFALATRNMRKNKYSASKLAVLLMIGILFSFVAITVPHSFGTWGVEQSYYDVGADMSVTNLNVTNSTFFDPINIPEVKDFTTVKKIYQWGYDRFGELSILGINTSNFADVSYWHDDYASQPLTKLMDILDEGKILIQSNALSALNLEVGDNLVTSIRTTNFEQQGSGSEMIFNEEIGGTYKYWPNMVRSVYYSDYWINELTAIIPMNIFDSYFNQSTAITYVDIEKSANHTIAYDKITTGYENFTSPYGNIAIESAELNANEFLEFNQIKILFTMFDTLLLVTMVASLMGVGYFSFLTMAERKREIGVFRAVGMVSKQIFILLVVEAVILVLSSILMGALAGIFVSSNFFLFLTSEFSGGIPPIRQSYPPLLTIGYLITILVLSVIAAAIPARSTATKQTGSILRAE